MNHFAGLLCAVTCVAQVTFCQGPQKASFTSKNDAISHYDVISIKPASPDAQGSSFSGATSNFAAKNISIASLVANIYQLREDSIVGIPAPLSFKRFDIVAKLVDVAPQKLQKLSDEQYRKMLEAMLYDRFALKLHEGTKDRQVYVLTQIRSGAKIKPSAAADKPVGGLAPGAYSVTNGHFKAHAVPIAALVGALSGAVQREAIDETKLQGVYDFDLTWDAGQSGATAVEGADTSLFTALQEKLGLKLAATKRPVPILIVDHVEMPSPD